MEPESLTWKQFLAYWPTVYQQDHHVTIIGPTGCGKTTLVQELIKCRGHVVAFGVKHVDQTMSRLLKDPAWHRAQSWAGRRKGRNVTRILLWPKVSDLEAVQKVHQKVFGECIRSIYKIGHWTIWIDELTYLADHAGLKKLIRQAYILMRSNRVSIVASAQRPAWVPLEAYNQASHLFLFRTGDERDLIRLGSMNGTSARQVAAIVSNLPRHHFLHVDLTNGRMVTSTVTP